MSERLDERTDAWPLRPWIMAAICAAAGLAFHYCTDTRGYGGRVDVGWQAAATFVAIAAISFVMTVEKLRWLWAIGFAVGWGAVIALVGWFTARYNVRATIFEWPYLSGLFAVLLAAPLFQTIREEGAWRFPYKTLHSHAWNDAVIGAASLFFVGITFLLAWLIGGLFDVIGIHAIKDLLKEEWFGWMLAGFAFGGAVGMLRERDRLTATLQRLVMVVFSVLAPVLAVALVLFLASIPFTGLGKLWSSWVPATPMLLSASAGAILLANAVIGDGREDRAQNRILRWSSLALIAVILPLAGIAALSMGIRIGEYGWTPERIWGVIAVAVAIAYGLAGWWSIWRGRLDFDDSLRPTQTKMAISLCGLALVLALPILDFGAISARSQIARLERGKVKADDFDWTAMAFDFGPAGRKALEQVAKSGLSDRRDLAKAALAADDRYTVDQSAEVLTQDRTLDSRLRILTADIQMTPELRKYLTGYEGCGKDACALMRLDSRRLVLVANEEAYRQKPTLKVTLIDLDQLKKFDGAAGSGYRAGSVMAETPESETGVDLSHANVEIRQVTRRQAFVNGKPVGETFP